MATTWTNESTLLRKNSTFSRWELENSPSTIFPPEIFMQLISWCASGTLFALRRVSKFMNILILESHGTWRKLFYQRHWRLRHDIENIFIGTDPDAADKTGWRDVCPDEDIDWFGEYRRNHINAVLIRSLIEEIKPKLQKIVDRVAVPKAGVTDPSFFEKGCTDNEIDTMIEMAGTTITNDLRELLKVTYFWIQNFNNKFNVLKILYYSAVTAPNSASIYRTPKRIISFVSGLSSRSVFLFWTTSPSAGNSLALTS
jgi:hypothetical protein